jgi:anti-anti-sigma factor
MPEIDVISRDDGRVLVLDLHGDLDGGATDRMKQAQTQAAELAPAVLVLNFAELGYMNSTGIALVVGLLAEARRLGTEVRVCGLSDHYRHIFEITRLADFVSFHPDEHAAVDDQPTTTSGRTRP